MKRLIFSFSLIAITMTSYSQIGPGSPATELSLPDQQGQPASLSSFRGKIVLLDFWASWCGPCRHNNPQLVKLYKKYHPKGFEIYGVSLDTDAESWKQAIHHDKLAWTQVIDDRGWNAQSTVDYHVDAIPSSFLIDREGVIRVVNGSEKDIEKALRELL